jgi:hypothetical protein
MVARSMGEATGPQNGPGRLAGADQPVPTGLGPPAWAHLGPVACLLRVASVPESSRSFPLLHVALVVSFSSSWMKLLILQDSALFRLAP